MTVREVINCLEILEDKEIEVFCANLIAYTNEDTGRIMESPDLTQAFPIRKTAPTTIWTEEGVVPRETIIFGVHLVPVNLSKAETNFMEVEIEQ